MAITKKGKHMKEHMIKLGASECKTIAIAWSSEWADYQDKVRLYIVPHPPETICIVRDDDGGFLYIEMRGLHPKDCDSLTKLGHNEFVKKVLEYIAHNATGENCTTHYGHEINKRQIQEI